MSILLPPSFHYTVSDSISTLRFEFPVKKNWFIILFCFVALGVILYSVSPFLLKLLKGDLSIPTKDWEFILSLLMYIFAFGVSVVELLWGLSGKEVVEVNREAIMIRHDILSAGVRKKNIPAEKVRGLRIAGKRSLLYKGRRVSLGYSNFEQGTIQIKMDRRNKSFGFGAILTEEEARQIAGAICSRFPRYNFSVK